MCYRSCRADDAALPVRLRELAGKRRRFGYRCLHTLLRREGRLVKRRRVQRLYGEEASASGAGEVKSAPLARGRLPRCWHWRTSAEASTSYKISSGPTGASACSTLATTSR